jgi:hypothetical protein
MLFASYVAGKPAVMRPVRAGIVTHRAGYISELIHSRETPPSIFAISRQPQQQYTIKKEKWVISQSSPPDVAIAAAE